MEDSLLYLLFILTFTLYACVYVCLSVWGPCVNMYLWRIEMFAEFSGARAADGNPAAWQGCWQLNWGRLQEQQAPLASEPSPWLLFAPFLFEACEQSFSTQNVLCDWRLLGH